MATQDDVRKICAKLPEVIEGDERFGFGVLVKGKVKGFCWSWAERVDPKKARVINDEVLAICTPNLAVRDLLMASEPERYIVDPHYRNYPAVLVPLANFTVPELEDLLIEAWKTKAPKGLLKLLAPQGP